MSTNIISFIQIKQQRDDEQLEKLFQQANSQRKVAQLIQYKQPELKDRQLFLAFIAYAKERQLQPHVIFTDALKLPKHIFQAKYEMNWSSIVQLTATFLTIVQESDKDAYNKFLNQLNDCPMP